MHSLLLVCFFFFFFFYTAITDWSDVIMILHRFCMYVRSSWLGLVCWCVMWKSSRCHHVSSDMSKETSSCTVTQLGKRVRVTLNLKILIFLVPTVLTLWCSVCHILSVWLKNLCKAQAIIQTVYSSEDCWTDWAELNYSGHCVNSQLIFELRGDCMFCKS